MPVPNLDDIAERLFANFVAHDLDAVAAMFTAEATFAQNGHTSTLEDGLSRIAGLRTVLGDHQYSEARRVVGPDAVVEEHRVRSTTPSGEDVDLWACVVIRVDAEGQITSLHEYADPAPIAKLFRR